MICPHPQPFSPRRRELEFVFPLLGERARVRADFAIHRVIQQRLIVYGITRKLVQKIQIFYLLKYYRPIIVNQHPILKV